MKSNEKWFYGEKLIECVKQYKYLGIFFTTSLSWSLTKETLAAQARKALGMVYMYNYKCNGLPHGIYLEMFDKMILPILLYGSEIWGFEYSGKIEQVQHIFCKKMLGLSSNTVNEAALGELGRYPLAVQYHLRCINYWLKIVCMQSNRYPKACYGMLYNLDQHGKTTWATRVKQMLDKFGFRYVWAQQGVGDIDVFIEVFKTRLLFFYERKWYDATRNFSKLAVYTTYKYELEPERYLDVLGIRKYLVALSRLRCSSHMLEIERGRHNNIELAQRICTACTQPCIEDEFHFLIYCTRYTDLFDMYISSHIINSLSPYDNFVNLMQSKEPTCIMLLAMCITHLLVEKNCYKNVENVHFML